jgi:hypothetical protein
LLLLRNASVHCLEATSFDARTQTSETFSRLIKAVHVIYRINEKYQQLSSPSRRTGDKASDHSEAVSAMGAQLTVGSVRARKTLGEDGPLKKFAISHNLGHDSCHFASSFVLAE